MAKGVPAVINPKMLKWARVERGFSIDLVANKLNIDSDTLESYESGRKQLTFAKLRKFAQLYKRPSSIFYRKEFPKPQKIPGFRRVPESQESPLSPELRLEIRKFHQKREAIIDLEEFSPVFNWDYIGSVTLQEDPELIGQKIRSLLDIPEDFPKNLNKSETFNKWRERIENLGTLVFLLMNVEVHEMRGMSISDRPFPFIAINRKDSPQPRSFTLLHEFSHILLNDSSVCEIRHEYDLHSQAHEIFCNHVAGAALVPKDLLLKNKTVVDHGKLENWNNIELDRLSRRFRVSKEVILRRLLILGKTNSEFYGSRKALLGYPLQKGGGGGETSYERVLHTDGIVFTSTVLDALNNNAITYTEACEYLDISLNNIEPLENLLAEKGR